MTLETKNKYFTGYEKKRKLYNKIQPGTTWTHKKIRGVAFTVESVDTENKALHGTFLILSNVTETHIISFDVLITWYNLT